jgi:cysteine desulfurase
MAKQTKPPASRPKSPARAVPATPHEAPALIYLDHAAATPVSPAVQHAMAPYLAEQFFNPSAPYIQAKAVHDAYAAAKSQIAQAIGARGTNLVITASATEANNLAFTAAPKTARILVSPIEHPSVYRVAEQFPQLQSLRVDHHGRLDLDDLRTQITPDTQLISIALANHELGTIQPIADVAALVRAERLRRLEAGESTPLYFHSDASAALNTLHVNVARLGVDLLTISAAKIYGPKGVAALYVHPGVRLRPLILGGGQESGLRSGTESVPAVIGFAAAIQAAQQHAPAESKRLAALKQQLKSQLDATFLGHPKHQLASHLPLYFDGLDAERLIFALETRGVLVSTGAACSASRGTKSNVLTAIGLSDAAIAGSLRLTLGHLNDQANIARAAEIINATVATERARLDA